MTDILIYEAGSGGEIIIRNNDIVAVDGFENQPYLAQFGGSDWLFNDLFLVDDQQFTATTELALRDNQLNSAGLIEIQAAMKADLNYLIEDVPGTTINVTCSIPSKNRLNQNIDFAGTQFEMNWNPDGSFLTYKITE